MIGKCKAHEFYVVSCMACVQRKIAEIKQTIERDNAFIANQAIKIKNLEKERDTANQILDAAVATTQNQADTIIRAMDTIDRLSSAMTPSDETKAAYWGSDELPCMDWTLIKDLMGVMRAQALDKGFVDRRDAALERVRLLLVMLKDNNMSLHGNIDINECKIFGQDGALVGVGLEPLDALLAAAVVFKVDLKEAG